MKYAREKLGLTNIKLMVPFCRRIAEGKQVVERMRELGLVSGAQGLEIYVMCEIPATPVTVACAARRPRIIRRWPSIWCGSGSTRLVSILTPWFARPAKFSPSSGSSVVRRPS